MANKGDFSEVTPLWLPVGQHCNLDVSASNLRPPSPYYRGTRPGTPITPIIGLLHIHISLVTGKIGFCPPLSFDLCNKQS